MTRQTRTLTIVSVSVLLYTLLCLRILPVPISEPVLSQLLPVLPWNVLVWSGCYCLWEMGFGIFTFGDCTQAYNELMNDISTAKEDLRSRGVHVDS